MTPTVIEDPIVDHFHGPSSGLAGKVLYQEKVHVYNTGDDLRPSREGGRKGGRGEGRSSGVFLVDVLDGSLSHEAWLTYLRCQKLS